MAAIVSITPAFAVAPQLSPKDFAQLKARGFRSIISIRPDDEQGVELGSRQARMLARHHDLDFRHVPAHMGEVLDDRIIADFEKALDEVEGPVVAYCKSGTRGAILWAMAAAGRDRIDFVMHSLIGAGYDLDFLREDLEKRAAGQQQPRAANADPAPVAAVVAAELAA